VRPALASLAVLIATTSSSLAQVIPDLPTIGSSWTDVGYPKLFWTPTNGLTFGLYYAQIRPPGYDDWDDPPPYRASISIDGEISVSGSHHLGLDFKFPNFFPGWRLDLRTWVIRNAKQNYFGLGNESDFDKDNVTDAQPDFYKLDRRRSFVRATAQRKIVGDLRALLGLQLERWSLDTIPGTTLLGEQLQAGFGPGLGSSTADANLRLGLVFDTRNDEVAPSRGVWIEALLAIADSTVAGDLSYRRATLSAATYFSWKQRWVAAGRVVGQSMSGTPPVGTYFTIEASERAYEGLGGRLSHRAISTDRYLGRDKLFGNFEIRYQMSGQPQVGTLTWLAFLDVGRVFQPPAEDLEITLDGMHVGAGLGPILTIGRNGVLGWTFGAGPDGMIVHTLTSWTF
jgi:outer membrane protein assembly factor BamA